MTQRIIELAIDFYKDYDESEIRNFPPSLKMLWEEVRKYLEER